MALLQDSVGNSVFFRVLDFLCGGNSLRVSPEQLKAGLAKLNKIFWLLVAELLLTLALFIYSASYYLQHHSFLPMFRAVVLLGLSSGIFYFYWRAISGYIWAYKRLRLFTKIAPFLALASLAFADLYPSWEFKVAQILFALLLLIAAELVASAELKQAFASPPKPDA